MKSDPCFSYGLLYVGCLQVSNEKELKIFPTKKREEQEILHTKNLRN